jgi:hypothetical protein
VDGLRLAATEIGDRIALALQALRQERGVDVRRPLLRIDYRPEAAAAPFRFDMAGGKLHRTGCPAILRAPSQALYSVWDPGEELPALACEKCRPAAIESAHMRQDSSLDIIYGFLSIVDQFGSVLTERGREYRNSRRGRRLAKDLSGMFSALDQTQQDALQLTLASLDGLVKAIEQANRSLAPPGPVNNGRSSNGRPAASRAANNRKNHKGV